MGLAEVVLVDRFDRYKPFSNMWFVVVWRSRQPAWRA
jgi:hypothetical protein